MTHVLTFLELGNPFKYLLNSPGLTGELETCVWNRVGRSGEQCAPVFAGRSSETLKLTETLTPSPQPTTRLSHLFASIPSSAMFLAVPGCCVPNRSAASPTTVLPRLGVQSVQPHLWVNTKLHRASLLHCAQQLGLLEDLLRRSESVWAGCLGGQVQRGLRAVTLQV